MRGPQADIHLHRGTESATGFLGSEVHPLVGDAGGVDPHQARAATTGWLPDQKLGYAVNWNFGVQHSFWKDYVVDVRYLGTRGVHLLLQTMLNRVAQVTPTNSLPVYLTAPSQDELNALPADLDQLQSIAAILILWRSMDSRTTAGLLPMCRKATRFIMGWRWM